MYWKNMKGLDLGRWSIANGNKLFQERCTERFFGWWKIRDWSAQVFSPIAFAAKYSLPEDDENDGANYLPLRLCFFQNGLSTSCFENTLWSLCSIYTLMSQSVSNHLLFISLKHKPLLEMSRNYLHAIWFKGALQKLGFQSSHQKEAAFSGPSFHRVTYQRNRKGMQPCSRGVFFPQIYKSPGFRISQVKFQRWDHFPIWDGPILSDLFSYCRMIAYKSMWKFEVQISVQ